MFHFLTVVLIVGPRGHSGGLQNIAGLDREQNIRIIYQEVIMTRIAAVTEFQSTDHRESRDARNDPAHDASPNGDTLMERILENLTTTRQEKVLKRIASLPRARQDTVLDIRRQLTEGTYEVANRLDRAMDRVLEALTA